LNVHTIKISFILRRTLSRPPPTRVLSSALLRQSIFSLLLQLIARLT